MTKTYVNLSLRNLFVDNRKARKLVLFALAVALPQTTAWAHETGEPHFDFNPMGLLELMNAWISQWALAVNDAIGSLTSLIMF